MTAPRFTPPPVWNDADLDRERLKAKTNFIVERTTELLAGNRRYRQVFTANLADVQTLFAATEDLADFSSGAALIANPRLMRAARYLGGPPVSADHLDTLTEASVATRTRLTGEMAKRAAEIILRALDAERFQWLVDMPPRAPRPEERDAALRWTAGLMTAQQVQTSRRTESSSRQEAAVKELLCTLGLLEVQTRRINALEDLPVGSFSAECIVVGSKTDVPVRLRDGRLLLIECKVSNSELNSVKRLNRECGGKARRWLGGLGDRAIPAAVLAGVFRTNNLQDAQTVDGVTIFWEHDLTPLANFVRSVS